MKHLPNPLTVKPAKGRAESSFVHRLEGGSHDQHDCCGGSTGQPLRYTCRAETTTRDQTPAGVRTSGQRVHGQHYDVRYLFVPRQQVHNHSRLLRLAERVG